MTWPGDYDKHQKVTVLASKVDADVVDFPVLLTEANFQKAGADIFDTVRSDGGDIRTSTGNKTGQTSREVVSMDNSTPKMEVHTKRTLSSSSNTDIYVWYNGTDTEPAEDSTYGKENTWNSDYVMVQHMDDTTTSTITDSTSIDNDGTKKAANEPIEATGIISGKSQDYDGSDDYIDIADPTLGSGDFTFSLWVNRAAVGTRHELMQGNDAGFNNFSLFVGTDNKLVVFTREDGNDSQLSGTGTLSVSTDYLIHATRISSTGRMDTYINGSPDNNATRTVRDITSGTTWNVGRNTTGGFPMNGLIDEVRVLNNGLSSDWISTEYNNQSSTSTFYSVSDEQGGGGSTLLQGNLSQSGSISRKATFNRSIAGTL